MTEKEFLSQVWRPHDKITTTDGIPGKVLGVSFTTKSVRAFISGAPEWVSFALIETHATGKGGNADEEALIDSLREKVIKADERIRKLELEREQLQEKIVDAANKVKTFQSRTATNKTNLLKLEKKIVRLSEEQRKLAMTKENLQKTLDNLQLKNIIDSEDGIRDSVAAINDALGALGDGASDVSLEDILTPDADTARKTEFDAIMSE